ncbi:dihydrofolate reductase [Bosea sp. TAF32]|uniref:dihydrofolate reductase n=1 Tax=Bosea sp. TAF32 TaxID=3237482 RepID=UPI003F90784A
MEKRPIVLIAAVADNGVIGDDNRLIWRLKRDLQRFRSLTMGRPVLMGRKTFLSIGKPLPGREIIVLTRDEGFAPDGVRVAHSLDEALAMGQAVAAASGADSVTVAGGAEVYRQALPFADRLELTLVHASPTGDALFPDWEPGAFDAGANERHHVDADNEYPYTFVTYRRRG